MPSDDPIGAAQRSTDHGQADAHDDDADVLDAVISEEPLQVVLADGKRHPEHARDDAQPQENDRRTRPVDRR